MILVTLTPRAQMAGQIAPFRSLAAQGVAIALGLGLFALAGKVSIEHLRKRAWLIWGTGLLCLLALPFIGDKQGGSRLWIAIPGTGLDFQPTEVFKVGLVLVVAAIFADRKRHPGDQWWTATSLLGRIGRGVPLLLPLAVVAGLAVEDLGTAIVMFAIVWAGLLLGGARLGSALIVLLVVASASVVMVKAADYRMARITSHADRWDERHRDSIGFQTTQAEIGVARGGWWGTGVPQGRTKRIISEASTDFVYTVIAEDFGLVVALAVLAGIGLLAVTLMFAAANAPTGYGSLILSGVAVWLFVQTSVNVMMANGTSFPVGVPLPFVSYAPSGIIGLWLALAVCRIALKPARAREDSHDELAQEERYETRGDRRRNGGTRIPRNSDRPIGARGR